MMRRIKIKSKKVEDIEKDVSESTNKIYVDNNADTNKEKEQEVKQLCKYYKLVNNELVEIHKRDEFK